MTIQILESLPALAERTSKEKVVESSQQMQENSLLSMVLNAIPQYVAILDQNRQIIAANSSLVGDFSPGQLEHILGSRPGELLGCQNSQNSTGGCGTTESCQTCGAFKAILASQNGIASTNDCQITNGDSMADLDLNISASPVEINGRPLTFVSIQDIADKKRLQVLEKTFFHDVLNSAGGAQGIAEALDEAEDMEEVREFTPLLLSVTHQLVAEIQSQRDLLAAESGSLIVATEDFGTLHILLEVMSTYISHQVATGKHLVVAPEAADRLIQTSKPLLHRVLGNMVKNALEATEPEGTVVLGCDAENGSISFWVNNSSAMPRAIQLQVFNRSFTTKGTGRGIGTYSIRLLGEKYLGGKVSFESNEQRGTTFRICLPVK